MRRLTNLTELTLSHCKQLVFGCQGLSRLKLRHLDISYTSLELEDLKHLNVSQLEHLNISGLSFRDFALDELECVLRKAPLVKLLAA